MVLSVAEQKAFDFLKFTNSLEYAEWAERERNGTWETTVAMFAEKPAESDNT